MTDEEFIFVIKGHFDIQTSKEIRPSVIRTIVELIELLDIIENERRTRKYRVGNVNMLGNEER